jgi:hypothetical protein
MWLVGLVPLVVIDNSDSFFVSDRFLPGSLFPWLAVLSFWMVGLVVVLFFNGEFDPGSGRTLAACLTHASRAVRPFGVHERRTGE